MTQVILEIVSILLSVALIFIMFGSLMIWITSKNNK